MMQTREPAAAAAARGRSTALVPAFRERAAADDEASAFPAENFADLRRSRALALTAGEDDGGAGLWSEGRFTPYYELMEALAYADCSTGPAAAGALARAGRPGRATRRRGAARALPPPTSSARRPAARLGRQRDRTDAARCRGVYASELTGATATAGG